MPPVNLCVVCSVVSCGVVCMLWCRHAILAFSHCPVHNVLCVMVLGYGGISVSHSLNVRTCLGCVYVVLCVHGAVFSFFLKCHDILFAPCCIE